MSVSLRVARFAVHMMVIGAVGLLVSLPAGPQALEMRM